MQSGGSGIPKEVRSGKSVDDAVLAANLYCDRIAHFPLGKNREYAASVYSFGQHIVKVNDLRMELEPSFVVCREVNVHPMDIWKLCSLSGKHYKVITLDPNPVVMDGKYVCKDTLARTGINAAMLGPKPIGRLTCEHAIVNGGGKIVPSDWRLSLQQRERQQYRQWQMELRDTKHGIPVAKEYKGASQLHSGLTERLNFAPTNVLQVPIGKEKDTDGEESVSWASRWHSVWTGIAEDANPEPTGLNCTGEDSNNSLTTPTLSEVCDIHAETPHELSLGCKEAGAESDSASEAGMESDNNMEMVPVVVRLEMVLIPT